MTQTVLEAENLSKMFYIFQQQKTLFRLSKSYLQGIAINRELWALKNIQFKVREGEKIAVIGRNGAGKTTLLRVLAGIYQPTSGTVTRGKDIQALFNYSVGLNPFLSVLDNIYLLGAYQGILVSEVKTMVEEIIEFAELRDFLYVPAKDLSSGQKQRLLFSVFIKNKGDFFLFDESVSVADMTFQLKADAWFNNLMNSSKTIIITSHSLSLLQNHCSRALWLEKGEIKLDGPADTVIKAYSDFCRELEKERLQNSAS